MADFREQMAAGGLNSLQQLAEMLQKQNLQKQSEEAAVAKMQQEHQLKEQGAKNRLQEVLSLTGGKLPPGAGLSVGPEGASITRPASTGMVDLRQEAMDRRSMADYSKRLERTNGFNSALQDIEGLTNRTGQGGVVTNPSEKLISAGTLKSAIPTSIMGLGEVVGVAPKGGAEERKALERLQLEYQKSMSGMRTSEEMAQREKQAMGWMASGDPALVAKGVRSLAKNVRNATKMIQGGYPEHIREQVHSISGDPLETLGKVYEDPAISAPVAPHRGTTSIPVSQPAPQSAQQNQGTPAETEEQEYLRLRQKHRGF